MILYPFMTPFSDKKYILFLASTKVLRTPNQRCGRIKLDCEVDDERSKNAVEIEFLMRSNISKSSLLMRLLNRDKRQTRRFHENYTTLIENFACGADVMIPFADSWG